MSDYATPSIPMIRRLNFKQIGYTALMVLLVAFAVKWLGAPVYFFWALITVAVFLKLCLILRLIQEKKLKPGPGLYLIMVGVALILISVALDKLLATVLMHKVLFYCALALKFTGIVIILSSKEKAAKPQEEQETI